MLAPRPRTRTFRHVDVRETIFLNVTNTLINGTITESIPSRQRFRTRQLPADNHKKKFLIFDFKNDVFIIEKVSQYNDFLIVYFLLLSN